MTIGIDIRMLASDQKSGVEEYVENLLLHMLPTNPEIKFKLFYCSFRKPLNQYSWLELKNVALYNYKIPNNLLFMFGRLFNWPKIDKLIDSVDIFFSPHFFLAPLSENCRRVTTIHDLSFDIFPEYFSLRQKFWHKFEMTPARQARLSDKIIAVSESTKEDLSRYYNIDPARIRVVYSGISADLVRPPLEELNEFRQQKSLPDKFLLFLGKLEPRKNVPSIIRAFNLLKTDPAYDNMHLVIVGSKGWLCDELENVIKLSPFNKDIVMVGHVEDKERKFYYALASILIYPSFFEGFGFPPLEAMACGTPVIASNRSSLGEVVSNFGICLDPNNISEIVSWIRRLINDKDLRNHMIESGLQRCKAFNWPRTAKETLDIIINA